MLATGLAPTPTWADAGNPAFLTAARTPSGDYVLVGLHSDLTETFRIPLPTRGHAAASHPTRPEAVAFARRPGVFALVIDCRSGQVVATLNSPKGRHFYGHGVYSADGSVLFTTENDYENARGVVGVWDVLAGYKRTGEFDSGGVGPHELALLPDKQTLVIANGGIETHPESGRAKLNIPMMRPNLAYANFDGVIRDQAEAEQDIRRNSIRHLAVSPDGRVFFATQWQGGTGRTVPLAGVHRMNGPVEMLNAQTDTWRVMQGYAGSIATSLSGDQIALTSPRGNRTAVFDAATLKLVKLVAQNDVCGVAGTTRGFLMTTGDGVVRHSGHATSRNYDLAFDNHLLRL